MALLGTLSVTLDAQTSKLQKGLAGAQAKLETFGEKMSTVAKHASAAFIGGTVGIGVFVKAASDLEENLNVLNVGFGDQAGAVIKWAKVVSSRVGRSELQMREFAGTMQAMLAPMVGSQEAASEMSLAFSELAVDLGSFFNMADTDVLQALRAGITGEAEPLKRFGIVMNEAALDAFRLGQGIEKSTKEMTEAEKVALRFQFIMDKTVAAQGDATRTAGGYANQLKAMGAAFADLRVTIGGLFIEDATKWVGNVTKGLRAIRTLLENMSPSMKQAASDWAELGLKAAGAIAVFAGAGLAIPKITSAIGKLSTALKVAAGLSFSLVKGLASVMIIAIPAAAAAGAVRIVSADEEERSRIRKQFGITPESDIFEIMALTAKGVVSLGFEPLIDAAKDLVAQFTELGDDVIDGLIDKPKAGDAPSGGEADFSGLDDAISAALEGDSGAQFGDLEAALDASRLADLQSTWDQMTKDWAASAREQQARAVDVQSSIGSIADGFASAAMQHAPRIAGAVQAFADGFAAGGPLTGITSAFMAVAMETEGVKKAFGEAEKLFGLLVEALEPLFEGLAPLIKSFVRMTAVFLEIQQTFNLFGSQMEILYAVLDTVTDIIDAFTIGIAQAFNGLIESVAKFLEWTKVGKGFADDVRRLKIDMDDIDDSLSDSAGSIGESGGLIRGTNRDLEEATEQHAAALTNVPAGFALALERFRVLQTAGTGAVAASVAPVTTAVGDARVTMTVGSISITTDDPRDFVDRLKVETDWVRRTTASQSLQAPGGEYGAEWLGGRG